MTVLAITTLYDSHQHAVETLDDLLAEGVPPDAISLIANNAENRYQATHDAPPLGAGASEGATVGGTVGVAAGLLASLGLLAFPGIGQVVGFGWLAMTAAGAATGVGVGAATGGLIAALTSAGVSEAHANVYAEGVRRGGTLVTARVDEDEAELVEAIMQRHHPVNPDDRGDAYKQTDWTAFDASAAPYTPEEMAIDRARYLGEPRA
ncbi:MAG TPA: hypothetical protein VMU42_03440, partial [Candidatus Sulfotelmatobacter sp.]|nr:hypothetical protein [Candidatus Sulfotelmatobacter sp.]